MSYKTIIYYEYFFNMLKNMMQNCISKKITFGRYTLLRTIIDIFISDFLRMFNSHMLSKLNFYARL